MLIDCKYNAFWWFTFEMKVHFKKFNMLTSQTVYVWFDSNFACNSFKPWLMIEKWEWFSKELGRNVLLASKQAWRVKFSMEFYLNLTHWFMMIEKVKSSKTTSWQVRMLKFSFRSACEVAQGRSVLLLHGCDSAPAVWSQLFSFKVLFIFPPQIKLNLYS